MGSPTKSQPKPTTMLLAVSGMSTTSPYRKKKRKKELICVSCLLSLYLYTLYYLGHHNVGWQGENVKFRMEGFLQVLLHHRNELSEGSAFSRKTQTLYLPVISLSFVNTGHDHAMC